MIRHNSPQDSAFIGRLRGKRPDYEIRPRKHHRGVDLISDALPFGGLWHNKPYDAVEYAEFRSRSHETPVSI